jgi:quercetin dioxygenase-like cupin family protein
MMGDAATPGIHVWDWNEKRLRDGRASILFPLGDATNENRAVWSQFHYGEGQIAPAHSHSGWTFVVVIGGSGTVGDVELTTGQMVLVEPYVVYGPIAPGPDGITCMEIFENVPAVEPIWDLDAPDVKALFEQLGDAASEIAELIIAEP